MTTTLAGLSRTGACYGCVDHVTAFWGSPSLGPARRGCGVIADETVGSEPGGRMARCVRGPRRPAALRLGQRVGACVREPRSVWV